MRGRMEQFKGTGLGRGWDGMRDGDGMATGLGRDAGRRRDGAGLDEEALWVDVILV